MQEHEHFYKTVNLTICTTCEYMPSSTSEEGMAWEGVESPVNMNPLMRKEYTMSATGEKFIFDKDGAYVLKFNGKKVVCESVDTTEHDHDLTSDFLAGMKIKTKPAIRVETNHLSVRPASSSRSASSSSSSPSLSSTASMSTSHSSSSSSEVSSYFSTSFVSRKEELFSHPDLDYVMVGSLGCMGYIIGSSPLLPSSSSSSSSSSSASTVSKPGYEPVKATESGKLPDLRMIIICSQCDEYDYDFVSGKFEGVTMETVGNVTDFHVLKTGQREKIDTEGFFVVEFDGKVLRIERQKHLHINSAFPF
jgi:hypothetical protein